METRLNRWYYDESGAYCRDTWVVPEQGTEIWCTAWPRGQRITPYGDGCHVCVGVSVYHCDQLMEILTRLEKEEGAEWGIENVNPTTEKLV